jgi:hypothetical protein
MRFQDAPVLSHNQAAALIAAVGDTRTVLVQGENGIGKTAMRHTFMRMKKFKDFLFPKPVDCTQLDIGDHILFVPDHELGVTRGMPNERYGVSMHNSGSTKDAKPVFILLDEYAKAPKHVKDALSPLIYDRRLGPYDLPKGSVVVCFSNLTDEGLGDFIEPHQRNRLMVVTMRKPSHEEWINDFAVHARLHPLVIAFVKQYPRAMESFVEYYSGMRPKNDLKNNPYIFNPTAVQGAYASPRSLHAASDHLYGLERDGVQDIEVLDAGLVGLVGAATAADMLTLYRLDKKLPDFEAILLDPLGTEVPDTPAAQLLLVYKALVRAETREQAEAVSVYLQRFPGEMQSVFVNQVAKSPGGTLSAKFLSVHEFNSMLARHSEALVV